MNDSRMPRRGGLIPLVVGLMTMALVASGSIPSNASSVSSQSASSAAPAAKPVLASDFGKATSRVKGTFGKGGTVTGTFTPRRFKVSPGGDLMAVGRLTATMTRANGNVVGTDTTRIAVPVQRAEGQGLRAAAPGDCDILNLVLGPLDLDLLGLKVHLDRVVLNIIAASGAGNLLGNLLCAVAGLLDTNGVLTQISQILNSILGILRL